VLRVVSAFVLLLFVSGAAHAGSTAYYRFENNLSDSAGGPGGSMLSGSDIYTTSVPVTTIPQNGLADIRSLLLAPITIPSFNYAFPFNTPGNATLEFWVNPQQSIEELQINLLFLPVDSPNLNQIERLCKFIKQKCLKR
jgi:hypothetical protein